jgi:hypothetical protein
VDTIANQKHGELNTDPSTYEEAKKFIDSSFEGESVDKAIQFINGAVYLQGNFNSTQLKGLLWILLNQPEYDATLSVIYSDE